MFFDPIASNEKVLDAENHMLWLLPLKPNHVYIQFKFYCLHSISVTINEGMS